MQAAHAADEVVPTTVDLVAARMQAWQLCRALVAAERRNGADAEALKALEEEESQAALALADARAVQERAVAAREQAWSKVPEAEPQWL